MLNRKPGTDLKEARESQKLSIKKVAEETNMTIQQVQALEQNNFSIFPGETYTLGFLRSYAIYLKLNPDIILDAYRNIKVMETQIPMEELKQLNQATLYSRYIKLGFLSLLIIGVCGLSFYLYKSYVVNTEVNIAHINTSETQSNDDPIINIIESSLNLPPGKTDSVNFVDGQINVIIQDKMGIDFVIKDNEYYLIIDKINGQKDDLASIDIKIYPGNLAYTIKENESIKIEDSKFPNTFTIELLATTARSVKILIDNVKSKDVVSSNNKTQATNILKSFTIQFYAQTTKENYIEFYVDGKEHTKGLVSRDRKFNLNAQNSIQMKIGDAGGIKILLNGKPWKIGKQGDQVNKIIKKVKDPLKPYQYKLDIQDF